jgi:hypothetical protein
MNCQGCHKADALSRTGGVPSLAGNVSRFLRVPDGRAFLGRVPGVAFAPLPDRRVADLLNWTLQTYDPAHVPADFTPYTAAEVGGLRKQPLITQSMIVRRALMDKIAEAK